MMNYNTPKVSIVVPSLNSISYIRECIDSILNQTLKDIEILCIDANSTDGTLEVLKNYEKKDKRLRVIISDKKSYGYQMNLGIKEAKGEYLGIVESDDYIKTNMYERLYEIAKKNDCEVVKGDFYILESNKGKYSKITPIDFLYNQIISFKTHPNIFNFQSINQIGIYRLDLLRTNQIKLNETPGASYQDNGLWFQIFALAKSIYFINEAFYMLRRDNPNSSVKSKEKVYCACEEYDFIRDFLKKHPDLEKTLAPICALHRFGNYMFTLERIDERYKLDFLKRFSQDFRKILKDKELDENLFGDGDMKIIYSIVENPENYYFLYMGYCNDMFGKLYFGASERIKWQLSYRIGKLLIDLKNPVQILKFPFKLFLEIKQFKFEQKIYKTTIKFYPNLQLPPLEEYSDYEQALKTKKHLSYILGKSFINNPILFIFKIKKIYKQYKKDISSSKKNIKELSDYDFLLNRHKQIFDYTPDFKCPVTFNEKLIYRILYDRSCIYSFLADKIKMRFYVASALSDNHEYSWDKIDILNEKSILFNNIDDLQDKIFETNKCKYLPKIYGIYKNIYDINFNELPNSFVLKTNHDCGGYVIVENKQEFLRDTVVFSNAMKKLKKHLEWNYYSVFREWHYKDIEPRVFAEELLLGENKKPADTYKFHIFDKENLSNNFIQVTTDRFDNYQRAMFDLSWNLAPFNFMYDNKNVTMIPKKPNLLDSMINISLILAKPFDYVRVDLYQFDKKIYIGELTFTHGAAGEKVIPKEWDKKLGDLWRLKRLDNASK
ncbi:sugar transferase [Campylobacter jejuni]|uniref:ATP-grasp fold amidoligase family protein n=1 Tax=Campylobacter jejuni TaxID=197 RepID=UPI000957B3A1|nr:ATP-grasp fold amidoligase family protein [Campylobacter jejuni]APU78347.1 sugar transferase [Campylobacter jejuni]EAC1600234.1 glycosyltransferase [Campylobacter jejuni]EAJ8357996.1 glycosyltransferase [Campylobacter jejuni]EAL9936165.1 glycosyltransferase [Campylobacter jejuni]ECB9977602.1 glycosyltransferase [Campylobacter jejuni]